MNQTTTKPDTTTPLIIYILYLVGIVIPLVSIVGIIWAHIARGSATGLIENHLVWGIRTFWFALLFTVIGLVLTMVYIGFLVVLAAFIWSVVRIIVGLVNLQNGKPMPNVQSMLL
ncbi:MAG: hypothetical protein AAF677_14595 [Pseudomonadota bacterium]